MPLPGQIKVIFGHSRTASSPEVNFSLSGHFGPFGVIEFTRGQRSAHYGFECGFQVAQKYLVHQRSKF